MNRDPNGLGWFVRGGDMTDMLRKAVRGHLDVLEPDVIASSETHLRNTVLRAESAELDFDFGKEMFLNRARWTRLVREYVPRDDLHRFMDQCVEIMTDRRRSSTANMLFRDPKRYERKHRWGGCLGMAAFTAGNLNDQHTLTLYSRTTYIGYMGLMDICLAHVIIRTICEAADVPLSNIAFQWHIANQQFHYFKSLPHMFTQPDLMERLEFGYYNPDEVAKWPPTWQRCVKDYTKVWDAYDEYGHDCLELEKFGPRRRVKRRLLEHYEGIEHVSVPLTALDLEPAE